MTLAPDSLAAAARTKAQQAHQQLVSAEDELHVANEALRDALPAGQTAKLVDAAKRTVAAEQKVQDAAVKLEVVDVLLSQAASAAPESAKSGASGAGAASVIPYLKNKRT